MSPKFNIRNFPMARALLAAWDNHNVNTAAERCYCDDVSRINETRVKICGIVSAIIL